MPSSRSIALLALTGLAMHWPGNAAAHGGGLDGNGCHHDRKRGDYHCHRAPQPRATPEAQRAAGLPVDDNQARRAQGRQDATVAPACHTGPRGGTYTLTASGRKNYGGC
jgi:hypothetical protein